MEVFEQRGYEAAGVVEIANAAGVTTGSLYHHFESKHGLFVAIRRELERRIRDRMEGAAAAMGGNRQGAVAALLIGFDAAVKLKALRILSEHPMGLDERTLLMKLEEITSPAPSTVAAILLGAWRAALAEASTGQSPEKVRTSLEWVLQAAAVTSHD